MRTHHRDSGQALGFVLMAVAVVASVAVAAAHVSVRMVSRSRAQTAADAAALAGAEGGRGAASRIAALNGAVLIAYLDDSGAVAGVDEGTVTVTVRIGAEEAVARASEQS